MHRARQDKEACHRRLKIPPSQKKNPHRRKCKLVTQREASGILTEWPDEKRRCLMRISCRDSEEERVHWEGGDDGYTTDCWDIRNSQRVQGEGEDCRYMGEGLDGRNSRYMGKAGTLHE